MTTLKQLPEKDTGADKETQLGKIRDVLLDKEVYDTDGKKLGTVADVALNKNMAVSKIILDSGEQYSRGRISATGDIVLIKIAKPAKKPTNRKEKQVQISANAQVSETEAENAVNPRSAKRRYGDFSFLLGKTADKNIVNFYGEVMIHCGETVTVDVLRQAKMSGKLIELCLHVIQ